MKRKDFASNEEFWVYRWLKEAERKSLVWNIVCQPGPFELAKRASVTIQEQLKTKTKNVDMFLFHPHAYTPDFSFFVGGELLKYFKFPLAKNIVVDVKGSFNKFGDQKQFSINQKWMWDKYKIYVQKIVPETLFKKTWVPMCCRYTPAQGKPVKKYIGYHGIDEFIMELKK